MIFKLVYCNLLNNFLNFIMHIMACFKHFFYKPEWLCTCHCISWQGKYSFKYMEVCINVHVAQWYQIKYLNNNYRGRCDLKHVLLHQKLNKILLEIWNLHRMLAFMFYPMTSSIKRKLQFQCLFPFIYVVCIVKRVVFDARKIFEKHLKGEAILEEYTENRYTCPGSRITLVSILAAELIAQCGK